MTYEDYEMNYAYLDTSNVKCADCRCYLKYREIVDFGPICYKCHFKEMESERRQNQEKEGS